MKTVTAEKTGATMKTVLTYSAMNAFRNCPCKYRYRYLDQLRPLSRADSLTFGSVVHGGLELWYRETGNPDRLCLLLDYVDASFPHRGTCDREKAHWHLARAMLLGYVSRYPQEEFEIIAVERKFEAEIRNPDTGGLSRAFSLAGKVDGIIRRRDGLYLLEHKTASRVDAQYIDKLWTDTQIHLYALALRKMSDSLPDELADQPESPTGQLTGQSPPANTDASLVHGIFTPPFDIKGIIYNVLLKPRLSQRQGETVEEYEARKQELAAKNKSGKSTAKRHEPESDEEFQARLADWYARPDAFHREILLIDENRLSLVQEEVWTICQQLLEAKRRGKWLQNTSFCFAWQRPCEYFPLCQSGGNPALLGNLYEIAPPHEELSGDASDANDSPLEF